MELDYGWILVDDLLDADGLQEAVRRCGDSDTVDRERDLLARRQRTAIVRVVVAAVPHEFNERTFLEAINVDGLEESISCFQIHGRHVVEVHEVIVTCMLPVASDCGCHEVAHRW